MAEEEEQQEMATTDDVLKELHGQTEDMVQRYGKHVKRLLEQKDQPATKGDIAELYHAMSSDGMTLVGEFIAETAAAFRDVGEMIDSIDGGGEDDELSEETIQIYSTIKASINAFEQLAGSPLPEPQKQAFQQLLGLNRNAAEVLESQYGDELKEAFEETLKQAQEGTNADSSAEETAEKEATPAN